MKIFLNLILLFTITASISAWAAGGGSFYGCVVGNNDCAETFPIIADVKGWQDLKWGQSLESIQKKYKGRFYQRTKSAPYLIRAIQINNLDFGDAALIDKNGQLNGVILVYNSNQDDLIAFKEIIAKFGQKYGRPTVVSGSLDSNKQVITDSGEIHTGEKITLSWSFPSTVISVEAIYLRAGKLHDNDSFNSQMKIFYEATIQNDEL